MTITKEDLEEEVLQGIYEVRVAPERKQGCTKFINFGKLLVKLDRLQSNRYKPIRKFFCADIKD